MHQSSSSTCWIRKAAISRTKKITLLYHNSAYGKEPIRTLEDLAKKHGYKLSLLPVDHPGQEQKSQWLEIRRDRPDYVIMYGWGV
ncbi:MAG: ABC transporter substrate-binding protein [Thiolinea sp.]